ncbi:hypothetical protein QQS21_008755 [Conoideocrella luteorostrata]|uniref:Kinetochore protein mis13 n=1 Tax=Conoideocrella luteorostrata TaxID=1105319 RepID=A0AAJ0FR36_9HYPO|nr:hypothetical protein QQS21_008755 [Conoideocrella luteorostrata]
MTTLVATQQALQLLSMSNQQERRTSKRQAAATDFERDDDFQFVRKSKRPRTEEAEPMKRMAGRGRPIITMTETAEPEPTLVATAPAVTSISASTRTGLRRSSRRKGSDGVLEDEVPQTGTRSARKSTQAIATEINGTDESQQNGAAKAVNDQSKEKTLKPVRRWEPSPTPRRPMESSKIALPMSDTPVINRNKEMRKKGGKSNRRSSLGSRGRRASSLIDSGQTATPHRDVNTKEFYKHISGEGLPEPRRMKQLLMWCGERALPAKPPHGTANSEAILGARAIQDQILKEFAQRSDFSDWFSRDDDESPPSTAVLMPNPRNIELDEKLVALEARIQRLQKEKQAWQAIRQPPPDIPPVFTDISQIELPDFDLLEPEEGKIRTYLAEEMPPFSKVQSQTQDRIRKIQASLEFEVDQLSDNVHKLEQRVLAAGRQADKVLSLSATRLKERERKERESAGTNELPLMEVLRGLSGILPEGNE